MLLSLQEPPLQIFKAFEAEFLSSYVNPQRMMFDKGIAVFADSIKIVANDVVLAGGPDFSRLKLGGLMPAVAVWAAIEGGGRDCLIQIVGILQSGDTSPKQAKAMGKASRRFATMLEYANHLYLEKYSGALIRTHF